MTPDSWPLPHWHGSAYQEGSQLQSWRVLADIRTAKPLHGTVKKIHPGKDQWIWLVRKIRVWRSFVVVELFDMKTWYKYIHFFWANRRWGSGERYVQHWWYPPKIVLVPISVNHGPMSTSNKPPDNFPNKLLSNPPGGGWSCQPSQPGPGGLNWERSWGTRKHGQQISDIFFEEKEACSWVNICKENHLTVSGGNTLRKLRNWNFPHIPYILPKKATIKITQTNLGAKFTEPENDPLTDWALKKSLRGLTTAKNQKIQVHKEV